MTTKEYILSFNWETDIIDDPRSMYNLNPNIDALTPLPFHDSDPYIIRREPEDTIKFKNKINDKIEHPVTAPILLNSLDKYLYYYFRLKSAYISGQTIEIKCPKSIKDPEIALPALKKCYSRKYGLAKELHENIMKDIQLTTNEDDYLFSVPKFAATAYLNDYFQIMNNRIDNHTQRDLFLYDGLPVRNLDYESCLPPWSIEDYLLHEYQSCISLSIEITSILIELDNVENSLKGLRKNHQTDSSADRTMNNNSIAEQALAYFSENILLDLVKSQFFFSRIAVARLFFRQVILGCQLFEYRYPDVKDSTFYISPQTIRPIFEYADIHCRYYLAEIDRLSISREIQHYQITDKQDIEEAMKHIESLLSMVDFPVGIAQIKQSNILPCGLAIFCNPKHKYVSKFQSSLSSAHQNAKQVSKSNKYPNNKGSLQERFKIVHGLVVKAIEPYL